MKLENRQRELGNLHKYTEFLEKVVSNNKDVDDSQKNTIDTLKDRFTNLKNENKKLNKRKADIVARMDQVKEEERKTIKEMDREAYRKQETMN